MWHRAAVVPGPVGVWSDCRTNTLCLSAASNGCVLCSREFGKMFRGLEQGSGLLAPCLPPALPCSTTVVPAGIPDPNHVVRARET